MGRALRLFILAGEASGDRIAADLVRRLRQRLPLKLSGIGGDELVAEGLPSLYPMADLSVMGLTDVVKRLPLLLWRVEQTARAVLREKPDLVVLVDAQEFSALVARRLRGAGYKRPILLYVSPSVWARHPERAARIRPLFDEVLAVLPFEPAAMRRLGGPPTSYVGHPSLGEIVPGAVREKGLVALLPGSREGELRRHLPMFRLLVERLARRPDIEGFFLPTLPGLAAALREETGAWAAPVRVVADRSERRALQERTTLAVCCAGTATLELAMGGIPMAVVYVMDRFQARKYAEFGRPAVSLPNIILGDRSVPELVLDKPDAPAVIAEVQDLLDNGQKRRLQVEAFARLQRLMQEGAPEAPREDPADRVLAHFDPGA